jgi:hypothetical protein
MERLINITVGNIRRQHFIDVHIPRMRNANPNKFSTKNALPTVRSGQGGKILDIRPWRQHVELLEGQTRQPSLCLKIAECGGESIFLVKFREGL